MVNAWYWSVVRTATQTGWGLLVAWGVLDKWDPPGRVPEELVNLAGILVVVVVLRLLERAPKDSVARKLATGLMLGVSKTPVYPPEHAKEALSDPGEAVSALRQLLRLAQEAYPLDVDRPAAASEAIDRAAAVVRPGGGR